MALKYINDHLVPYFFLVEIQLLSTQTILTLVEAIFWKILKKIEKTTWFFPERILQYYCPGLIYLS